MQPIEYAEKYIALDWSLIPILPKTKKPAVPWAEHQNKRATLEEVKVWLNEGLDLAVVTGKGSGICVVDVDPRHGGTVDGLTDTLVSLTGGGGFHYFYKYQPNLHCRNGIRQGIDFKTDGGYVILPPSTHSSGNIYRWRNDSFNDKEIQEVPNFIIEFFKNSKESSNWKDNLSGTNEGNRNEAAASYIGKLLSAFPGHQWEDVCWDMLKGWNMQNNPPLSEKELRTVFDSIKSRESKNKPSLNQQAQITIPNALEFLALDFGDTPWLIENLLPIGGSGIIVAKRESYKTWLALHIAECVTKGLPVWGILKTSPTKVLYISNDDPAGSFRKRLSQFRFDTSLFVYHQSLPSFSVDVDNGSFSTVKGLVAMHQIGLVIVDILRNTHSKDSNNDKEAMEVLNKFKELREVQPELVLLLISHPAKESAFEKRFGSRKSEEAVGSYYWEAAVDTVISLTKTTDAEQTDSVVITVTKDKQSEQKPKPFVGIRRKVNSPVEFINEESLPEKQKLELAKEAILALLETNPNMITPDIVESIKSEGISGKRNVEEALKNLYDSKKVFRTKKKPYCYNFTGFDKDDNPLPLYRDCGIAEDQLPGSLFNLPEDL